MLQAIKDQSAALQEQSEALQKLGSKGADKRAELTAPRNGGKTVTGVWTGNGASGLGTEPTSSLCMRDFNTDLIKNYNALAPIEDRCKRVHYCNGDWDPKPTQT